MGPQSEPTRLPAEPRHIIHQALQSFALLLVMTLVGIQPVRAGADGAMEDTLDDALPLTLDEVATGELLFKTALAGEYVSAVQLHTRADIQINGFIWLRHSSGLSNTPNPASLMPFR